MGSKKTYTSNIAIKNWIQRVHRFHYCSSIGEHPGLSHVQLPWRFTIGCSCKPCRDQNINPTHFQHVHTNCVSSLNTGDIKSTSDSFQVILCRCKNCNIPRQEVIHDKSHITMSYHVLQFQNIECMRGSNKAPRASRG